METRAIKYTLFLALSLVITSSAGFARSSHEPITPATVTVPASEIPIANFERVNSVLLRGALPSDKGIEALSAHGVKTIVNLRMPGDGASNEERKVKQLGMNYIHIPMGFASPEIESVAKVLRIITDKNMQPVYIHCRQGADRTGMIVAIYRILVDNWQFKDAYAEMREHHFKPFLLGMKETVRTCTSHSELLKAVGTDERPTKLAERPRISAESNAEASGK